MGSGGNNSIDMILCQFYLIIPSIDYSTISFLTMINGALIQEIGGRKILKTFVITLYSYEILLALFGKN